MLKQIRGAMGNRDMKETFDVFVEFIDETYVEGKPGKENQITRPSGRAMLFSRCGCTQGFNTF